MTVALALPSAVVLPGLADTVETAASSDAGLTVADALPVIVPVSVSVPVILRLPAWVSVKALLSVWLPLSAPLKV